MAAITENDLRQFSGSENWYRHGLNRNFTYTDGVKYLADKAGAYWLIDEIALFNLFNPLVKAEEFQVWTLTLVADSNGATLTCDDGNDKIVARKNIKFTDFPLSSIKLYFMNNVLLLPSEY